MRVVVDSWAWLNKNDLGLDIVSRLKKVLTVYPKKIGNYPGDPPAPIQLFTETTQLLGVAREYFLQRSGIHEVEFRVNSRVNNWTPFAFNGVLREGQAEALQEVSAKLRTKQHSGGIIQAPCGYGKTIFACALIQKLQVPTMVVVHKDFLMRQWRERIAQFLPLAKVGVVQQNVCDFKDKHIVLAMIQSLAARNYGEELQKWPVMMIFDETHRVGAHDWSRIPPQFPAKYRIGLSATPRRKDRAENVFFYHIGPVIFSAKDKRLPFKVKRVRSTFKLVRTPRFNPNLASDAMILQFLCKSEGYNEEILAQLVKATEAGRKILVLSHRLNHLKKLKEMFDSFWKPPGKIPSSGYIVGGMKEKQLEESEECQVIFATVQMVAEALDIAPLDTLVLTTPMGDIEQAVGRILRSYEGKKEPIVVDMRIENVPKFKRLGEYRDKQYERLLSS